MASDIQKLASCLAPLLIVALSAMAPSVSRAGTFDVVTCGAAPGNANNAWTFDQTVGSSLESLDFCNGGGDSNILVDYNNALSVRDDLGTSESPDFASGYLRIDAPSGSRITGLEYTRHLQVHVSDSWRAESLSDDAALEGCQLVGADVDCGVGVLGGSQTAFNSLDTQWVKIGVRCLDTLCLHGGTLHHASAVLYSATVTVEESTSPIPNALSGSLLAGGWIKGSGAVTVSGTDAFGVRKVELVRDGTVVEGADTKVCDFTKTRPCADPTGDHSATFTLNTASWADGDHSLQGRVTDVAGNESLTAPISVQVDNHGPVASNVQAQGASSDAARVISWENPSAGAPVVGAQVSLCRQGGSCQTIPANSLTSAPITLPSEGTFTATVLLTDQAGNVGQSSTATLTYSKVANPPGGAQRLSPKLRLTTARLSGGKLRIVGTVRKSAKGSVTVKVKIRSHAKTYKPKLRRGRFKLTVYTKTRRASVTIRFKPGQGFKRATVKRTVRARSGSAKTAPKRTPEFF